ncbi:MAG TPA: hypothetical protein VL992_05480 [Tepidisphaeraceae bacterium]|nr:hypothetical protein [Tepidisphaeraceae bacterium]
MEAILIGIDDTDNDTSPGTGRVARRLGEELARRGARLTGITRHQFLKDPRIPYTSHNSGACLAIEWGGAIAELRFVMDLIGQWAAPGSDPGVCIAGVQSVNAAVMEWGWKATDRVLTMEQAVALATSSGLDLAALGGTGQGIIGALASVGLRADGNEGRFLDLPGLRELGGRVGLQDLKRVGIDVQHRTWPGNAQPVYNTLDWVRPRLMNGRPVWPVEWSNDEHAWMPVDRKKERRLE